MNQAIEEGGRDVKEALATYTRKAADLQTSLTSTVRGKLAGYVKELDGEVTKANDNIQQRRDKFKGDKTRLKALLGHVKALNEENKKDLASSQETLMAKYTAAQGAVQKEAVTFRSL